MDISVFNFEVCVKCWTYNHASYIENTLDGFCIQKVQFPYLCIIVDDASPDGEPEVIRNYLLDHFELKDNAVVRNEETDNYVLTFTRHKTNHNCFFAVFLLKYNHHGKKNKGQYFDNWVKYIKYHALCEGDDFWTDPLKLQKQVEFMDRHPEVGLCYTDYNHLDQSSNVLTMSMFEGHDKYHTTSYEQFLLKPGYLAPMTWLFRNDLSDLIKNATAFSDGSYAYMLEFMQNSRVSYLPIVTATYRSHAGSASSPTNVKSSWSFFKGVFDTQLYYSQKYPCSEELRQKVKIQGYLRWLPVAIMAGQHVFVEEARNFFESMDMDISLLISELEEGEKRKRSYAYRIGKKLMLPFSFLRRRFG